jgi:hypothetical protein
MKKPDQPMSVPNIGFVIATKRIAEDEQPACFMYREEPMDPKDSGWRLYAGTESEEYLDNPDNSGIYDPATILAIDPSIQVLLDEPIGSVFEREDGTCEWEVAEEELDDLGDLETEPLGGNWKIALDPDYERFEGEEGETVFSKEGRMVTLAVWDFEDESTDEICNNLLVEIKEIQAQEKQPIELVTFDEGIVRRVGFFTEQLVQEHPWQILYGHTVVGGEVAQSTIYFQDPEDRDWALETWKTVRKREE